MCYHMKTKRPLCFVAIQHIAIERLQDINALLFFDDMVSTNMRLRFVTKQHISSRMVMNTKIEITQ